MIISATEFKTNVGKYITLASKEDILITRNGKSVAKLVGASGEKQSITESLRGVIKDTNVSLEEIREERLAKYNESNH